VDIRRLTDSDLPVVRALLDADPIAAAMLIARFQMTGVSRSGGDTWGAFRHGHLLALVHVGGNVTLSGAPEADAPAATGAAAAALGAHVGAFPRRCVSIVGPRWLLAEFWPPLAPAWGPPRDLRPEQPLLLTRGLQPGTTSSHAPEPLRVTIAQPEDVTDLYQPSVDMFTEEVGVSPLRGSTATAYRARIALLVAHQRLLLARDPDGVVFKAEIAAVTAHTCHIQGVWVRPQRRNQGIGTAGMRATVAIARRFAPTVSLYVNSYNVPALRAYEHAGFHQVGTLATVYF